MAETDTYGTYQGTGTGSSLATDDEIGRSEQYLDRCKIHTPPPDLHENEQWAPPKPTVGTLRYQEPYAATSTVPV